MPLCLAQVEFCLSALLGFSREVFLVSSKTAPQTGPALSAVQGAGWGFRAQAKSPTAPNTGWSPRPSQSSGTPVTPGLSLMRGAAGFLFCVQSWGSRSLSPERLLGRQGRNVGDEGRCCRLLCSVVTLSLGRGLFNTEDLGGRGSLTENKGEIKGKLLEVHSCSSSGIAAAGVWASHPRAFLAHSWKG